MLGILHLRKVVSCGSRSFLLKPSIVKNVKPKIVLQHSCAGFQTTAAKKAIPPIFFFVMRPILNVMAFVGGRNFRKWWRALPKERKEYYWSKIRERRWKIAGAGGAAGLSAYVYYLTHLEATPITGRQRFTVVTTQQVEELSQLEFEKIMEDFSGKIVPPQHPCYRRVTRVANRLLKANKDLPQIYTKNWTVTVLEDPSFNAFVLPNGSIFVFTGMLGVCSSDDELGIVLGHEMAHSLLGHGGENVTTERLLSAVKVLLIGLLWAVLPTDFISLITYFLGAEVLDTVFHYPYGRLLENEADQVGLQLAAKACFDVRAAPAFWEKMLILEEMNPMQSLEWLSTHPSHQTRKEKLEEQLATAIQIRDYCDCPRLPYKDPRKELEAFRQAVSRTKPLPVAVRLNVPDLTATANGK